MLMSRNEIMLVELLSVSDTSERDAVYCGIGYAMAVNDNVDNKIVAKNVLYSINELTVIDLELLNDRVNKQMGLIASLSNQSSTSVARGSDFASSLGIYDHISPKMLESINSNYKQYIKAVSVATKYIDTILGD